MPHILIFYIAHCTIYNINWWVETYMIKILKTKILYENIKVLSPDNWMEMMHIVCFSLFFFF